MTKAQELAALQGFIDSLPDSGYLKPWLTEVRAEVSAEMVCDFPVSPSITATKKQCAALLEEAHNEAARLVAEGEQERKRIVARAEQTRLHVRTAIQTALAAVQI